MIGLRGWRAASLEIALTHDGHQVIRSHAAEGVPHTEGLRGTVPLLGVPTGVRRETRLPWVHLHIYMHGCFSHPKFVRTPARAL
jgi:hypothetical protein